VQDCLIMSEQLRIILIIIVGVSIFGLIIFVIVKNFIKSKIDYYLIEKNKKTKKDEWFSRTLLLKDP